MAAVEGGARRRPRVVGYEVRRGGVVRSSAGGLGGGPACKATSSHEGGVTPQRCCVLGRGCLVSVGSQSEGVAVDVAMRSRRADFLLEGLLGTSGQQ